MRDENQKLTPRELEIIACMAQGLRCKAMARQLLISEFTVRKHRANVMHKLRLHSAAEISAYAFTQATPHPKADPARLA